ncbi:Mobile element protein [Streptococcus pseudoporcinus]|uniref:Mobile element protein n=1 Tax=Streptococcus pseudoporcinus TaxID=361101 RepID=A0A4U9XU54_9STRE|nr:Mobile element protein [Streptococcus pseudoporcinus]
MSTFKRYDEEFKQSLVSTFIKLEKLSLNSVKTMGYPLLRLQNGSNSILKSDSKIILFLLPSKYKSYKNVMHSLKRRTLS